MAYSVPQIIRVRLDLREINCDDLSYNKLIWVAVDLSLLKSVQDFKNHISQKFGIGKPNSVQLYLQQCLLPPDETILLLRDGDLVKVVYEDITSPQEKQIEIYNNSQIFTNTVRMKQKRHIEKSSDPSFEIVEKKLSCLTEVGQKMPNVKLSSFTSSAIMSENSDRNESVISNNIETDNGSVSENCTVFDNADEVEGTVKSDSHKKKKRHKSNQVLVNEKEETFNTTENDSVSPGELAIQSKDSNHAEKIEVEYVSSLANESHEKIPTTISQPGSNCKKRKRKRAGKNTHTDKDFKYRSFSVGSCLSNLPVTNLVPRPTLMLREKSLNHKPLHNKHIRFEDGNHSDKGEEINLSEPVTEEMTLVNSRDNPDNKEKENSPSKLEKKQQLAGTNNIKDMPLWMIWENPHGSTIDSSKTDIVHHSTPTEKNQINSRCSLENGMNASFSSSNISQTIEKGDTVDSPQPAKKDYQQFPTLRAPPVYGNIIAYKILELSDSYCPEVSDYKEGRVINYNSQSDTVELELIHEETKRIRLGKFEVDGLDEDAVPKPVKQVSLRWPALIEPRLVSS